MVMTEAAFHAYRTEVVMIVDRIGSAPRWDQTPSTASCGNSTARSTRTLRTRDSHAHDRKHQDTLGKSSSQKTIRRKLSNVFRRRQDKHEFNDVSDVNSTVDLYGYAISCEPTAEDVKRAAEFKRRGAEQFITGKVGEAAISFSHAMRLTPGDSTLYCKRSVCWIALRLYHRSIVDARSAVTLKPSSAKNFCQLGISLEQLGKYDRSNACYMRAMELGMQLDLKDGKLLRVHGYDGNGARMKRRKSRAGFGEGVESPRRSRTPKATTRNEGFDSRVSKDGTIENPMPSQEEMDLSSMIRESSDIKSQLTRSSSSISVISYIPPRVDDGDDVESICVSLDLATYREDARQGDRCGTARELYEELRMLNSHKA